MELVCLPCVFDSFEAASVSKVLERQNARRCKFIEIIMYLNALERPSKVVSYICDVITHHMSAIVFLAFAFCFLYSMISSNNSIICNEMAPFLRISIMDKLLLPPKERKKKEGDGRGFMPRPSHPRAPSQSSQE